MSYSNNPASIKAGTGITIIPTTGTGSNTITIAATGTQTIAVRLAIISPVIVTNNDDVISIQVPGPVPVAVTLPVGITGRVVNIKDGLGLASLATPITITPTLSTIDSALTAVINSPFGALTLVYTGVEWAIL